MPQRCASSVLMALMFAAAPSMARAQARADVPVSILPSNGGAAPCSVGQIVGLDPRGDGFLSVLSTPGRRPYREIDRLYNGQEVLMCDGQGPWVGVVYPGGRHASLSDCDNAFRPNPIRWAYTGPCAYGWIHHRYVVLTAG